jgi:hypothetical protein
MCSDLVFFFSIKDKNFTTKKSVVDSSSSNYISHEFVRCPIYSSSKKLIGYKVSDDYVQQVAEKKYVVRLNNTYTFYDNSNKVKGTISWQYVFENSKPEIYYPVDIPASSTIISGTGKYNGKNGNVTLLPLSNGFRIVTIKFT